MRWALSKGHVKVIRSYNGVCSLLSLVPGRSAYYLFERRHVHSLLGLYIYLKRSKVAAVNLKVKVNNTKLPQYHLKLTHNPHLDGLVPLLAYMVCTVRIKGVIWACSLPQSIRFAQFTI